ncbi:2-dehydropantoate 2-reductase [Caldinitratiruptor microaerophilus]|uniref:2-dehydropantoate 2-reductase n=1 Tax=Caldinitratiruptor microaerophilus TaxID=671077 RepID=A0AA35CMJ8_9FIRM|nr:2-dehydropantoate 2-reductase [Caldinitratiruptor microaerophilus]BDG61239.1 2-dehydropantoate 2-reductase [Caldinitratiruptor microaerophilus]
MRVAVMGAGAIGCYFGGRLAQAGHEVHLIARGEHLRALRERGLVVRSELGDIAAQLPATDDPAEVGPVDLVLFTVKSQDTDQAAQAARPLVGPDTVVLTLQNGVDNPDRIGAVLGPEHVLGGSCQIEAAIAEPGVVVHPSRLARVTLGELDGADSPRARRIRDAFAAAGVEVRLVDDIRRALWEKLGFLATMSAFTTVTGLPIGPLRACPETWALMQAMLREVWSVGRAAGVGLADDYPDRTAQFMNELPPTMKTSMQRDRERGRRLEVEAIHGPVVRLGRQHGVPVPVTETMYGLLKLYEPGAPPAASGV